MAVPDRVVEGAPTLEELKRRADENPNELGPLRDLGWAYYSLDHTQEAIEALTAAGDRFPEDAETYYALGLTYKRAGQTGKALEAFERAISMIEKSVSGVRADMLRKLSRGQINQLEHGSWDLPAS
jgi:tetratricopeptide (TPR) repeat protein